MRRYAASRAVAQEIPLSTRLSTPNESALDRAPGGRKRAKKAIEERQVRRLLTELGLADAGKLLSGETPDFVFQMEKRQVGIEISMLFRSEPIEDAARRERIVSEARKLVATDHRFDRLDIWVAFGDKEISTVKEGAAALIRQLDGLVPRATFVKIEQDRRCLFWQITIWPSESRAGSWRAVAKSELTEALTRDELERAVARKDARSGTIATGAPKHGCCWCCRFSQPRISPPSDNGRGRSPGKNGG